MSNHLRAFLFDASHADGESLIDGVYKQWDANNAICLLNKNQPLPQLEKAILRADPNEVDDLSGSISKRKLAIVETPDLSVVALTSGTTSDPKPVELSFKALMSSANSLYRAANLNSDAKWLCCLPPYFIAGLSIFARSWVNQQRPIFHNSFDIEKIENEVKAESFDAISLLPNQLKKLLDAEIDLSKLQTILIGGSSIDFDLQNRVLNLGLKAYFTYGMTETFGGICLNHKLIDNTEAEIVEGQIYLHSGSAMSGYRHNQRLTFHKITADGWLATGDLGTYDDGVLNVTGRIDDLINSGGIKVEPEMIERALHSAGYMNVVVIGTQHKTLGSCVTVLTTEKNNLPAIDQLRENLRSILPSTHLPIRIATSKDFTGETSTKINRKQLASNFLILDEHNME